MKLWHAITSFGDSALLIPLIALLAAWLLLQPASRRNGLRWLIAVAVTGGVVSLSKLLFMGWDVHPPSLNFTGFSGHTALSSLFWPSAMALLLQGQAPRWRWLGLAFGMAFALAIAYSRLMLKAHSESEVILGALLGGAVAAWFISARPMAFKISWAALGALCGGMLVIVLLCYGRVFPSQHILQDIALWLSGHDRVFTRHTQLS